MVVHRLLDAVCSSVEYRLSGLASLHGMGTRKQLQSSDRASMLVMCGCTSPFGACKKSKRVRTDHRLQEAAVHLVHSAHL